MFYGKTFWRRFYGISNRFPLLIVLFLFKMLSFCYIILEAFIKITICMFYWLLFHSTFQRRIKTDEAMHSFTIFDTCFFSILTGNLISRGRFREMKIQWTLRHLEVQKTWPFFYPGWRIGQISCIRGRKLWQVYTMFANGQQIFAVFTAHWTENICEFSCRKEVVSLAFPCSIQRTVWIVQFLPYSESNFFVRRNTAEVLNCFWKCIKQSHSIYLRTM